jgi:predicted acylesterase/phospholipase RssA
MSKTIWILSGGGVRGAFEVGAITRLVKAYPPDCVLGCSAGAFNAAGFCYRGADFLEETWSGVHGLFTFYRIPWWDLCSSGLLDAAPLRKRLNEVVVGTPTLECVVNYTDLLADEEKIASNMTSTVEEFRIAVEASGTIPGLVELVSDRYCDGGFCEVAPISRALELGADTIILVSCYPLVPAPIDHISSPTKLGAPLRAFDTLFRKSLLKDVEYCKKVLTPNQKLIVIQPPPTWDRGMLDFSQEAIQEGIALGKAAPWQTIQAAS